MTGNRQSEAGALPTLAHSASVSVRRFLLVWIWVHRPSRVFSDAGPGLLLSSGVQVWVICEVAKTPKLDYMFWVCAKVFSGALFVSLWRILLARTSLIGGVLVLLLGGVLVLPDPCPLACWGVPSWARLTHLPCVPYFMGYFLPPSIVR